MTSLRPCGTSFHLTCMKKIVLQRTHLHCADCVEEFTKYGPNDQKMTCIYAIREKVHAIHDAGVEAGDMTTFEHLEDFVRNELIYYIYRPFLNLLFTGASFLDLYYVEYVKKPNHCADCSQGGITPGCWCDTPDVIRHYDFADLVMIKKEVDRYGPDVEFSTRYDTE